jgi:hypothetical protein
VNDHDAILSLHGYKAAAWAEIRSSNPLVIDSQNISTLVHIIGFKISCYRQLYDSTPAVLCSKGVSVFRNCLLTSSSGPVIASQNEGTNIVMQSCVVHNGAQGGILCTDGAGCSLHQVHCCDNAATGLELREGGFASLNGCHLYVNGQQGIMCWKNAGELIAKQCNINSHTLESGVLIMESIARLDRCRIYGNSAAGVLCQQKGNINVYKSEVHDNCEGVLIQDTGSAHGIFVGFDHRGHAAIIENEAHDNNSKGILITNGKNVVS